MKNNIKSLFLVSLFVACQQVNSMDGIKRGVGQLGSGTANILSGAAKSFSECKDKTKKAIIAASVLGLGYYNRAFILNNSSKLGYGNLSKLIAGTAIFTIGYKLYSRYSAISSLDEIMESLNNKSIKASDSADKIAEKWHFWNWRRSNDDFGKIWDNGFEIDNKKKEVLEALVSDAKIDERIYLFETINKGFSSIKVLAFAKFEKDKPDILTQDTLKLIRNQIDSERKELEIIKDKITDLLFCNTELFEERLLDLCVGQRQKNDNDSSKYQGNRIESAMRFFEKNQLDRLKDSYALISKTDDSIEELYTGILSYIKVPQKGSELIDAGCDKLKNKFGDATLKALCFKAAEVYFEVEKLYGRLMAIRDIISAQIKPTTETKKDDKKAENPAAKAKETCEKFKKAIENTRNIPTLTRSDFEDLQDAATIALKSLKKIAEFDNEYVMMNLHEVLVKAIRKVDIILKDLNTIINMNDHIRTTRADDDDEDDEGGMFGRKNNKKKTLLMFSADGVLIAGDMRFKDWISKMERVCKKLNAIISDSKPLVAPKPKGDGSNPLVDNSNLNNDSSKKEDKKEDEEKRSKEDLEAVQFDV